MKVGDKVKVNRDDPEWGRIAEFGEVIETVPLLVCVGGTIRANVLCEAEEVTVVETEDTFVTTVKIKVVREGPTAAQHIAGLTVRELADYLGDACRLDIDAEQYGQPDENNEISAIEIDWDGLKREE